MEIEKYGCIIKPTTTKQIRYQKGQVLGDFGIKYIKELPTEYVLKNKMNKQKGLLPRRKALFECHCGKKFTNTISLIKMGKVKSCGCSKKNNSNKKQLEI